ncbi:N-acetylmuramoyl-L-alanine amidase [Actinomyces oris]|uniref:N-acetylmuramoyl-L-alanine amidase n=1 Tax=Actinomyces oris TaxID=544580 RepID=A0AAW9KU10_9ACTO|nr:N-acetylmuramoyl-L-alanine amidase [Actinomyces oris]MEA1305883.1 N-acetylmuramoyl-L-alanine amidase [Actinomyces oris]
MNVPRALGRIAPRGGHRLSGHASGLSTRARVCRSAGLIALTSLLLSSLVPAAGAAPDAGDSSGQGETPAPVQILDLTTASGQVTEVGQSGLDDVQASAGEEAGSADAASVSAAPVLGASAAVPALTQTTGAAGAPVPSILPAATDPQADATLLTDPLEVDRFFVAGFTWAGGADLPEGVRIYLRVRENGTWSPWYLNEAADAGRDDRATSATGEFVTGGADAIQASVVGSSLPAGLKLALVPSRPQGEEVLDADDLKTTEAAPTPVIEETAASQPQGAQVEPAATAPSASPAWVTQPAAVPAAVSVAAPAVAPAATTANGLPVAVTTRAEWGANASYMSWDPEYARAGHVVVHHTAGTNSYSAGQSASIVRGIYYYHAVTLDWGDIGYNFLVDKFGTVFEGRSGSVAAPAGTMSIGAHARGVNTGTMGISMMGDYSTVSPSDAQLSSVGKMAGWFLKRAGVSDVTGWAGLHVWTTERYQAGSTISMPRILGHRDVGYTTCPGNVGYSKLGAIRAIAKAQGSTPQGSSSAPSTVSQDHPGAAALHSALGANGWIGPATSGVQASTKGGVFQRFKHGVGYWSPATGAQFVGEPVLSAWGAYGYQTGSMGYPRSGGAVGVGGSRHQIFEGGIAYWRPGGRVSFIHGSILSAWAASGWERSKVGLPTGRAVRQADGTMTQTFERGSISVAPNGKVAIR